MRPCPPVPPSGGSLGLCAGHGQTSRDVPRAPSGAWAAAAAVARDGKTGLLQRMQDRTIEVFRWDGKSLTRGKSLPIEGAGPESFATGWP